MTLTAGNAEARPGPIGETHPMAFLPGIALARRFYVEAVRPILADVAPDLPHAAALLGPGSEVLGFDTERSTDHDWGPRLQLFLHPGDAARHGPEIVAAFADRIPEAFLGYPTQFSPARPHGVEVTDAPSWFTGRVGFDPADGVTLLDWLATPTQLLREVVAGEVLHDGLDALERRRAALAWYPPDVWRYVLACQWRRIAQEEPFVGRTAEGGDEAGSRVVAARLARDSMRLHLLIRRRYPPYSKWLGTDAGTVTGLDAALNAPDFAAREAGLCAAYTALAEEHNALGLTDPLDPAPRGFHDRPFRVIRADRFADALLAGITDPAVAALPRIGAVDQFVDSTDALGHLALARAITAAALGC